jgi:hypothetical protein
MDGSKTQTRRLATDSAPFFMMADRDWYDIADYDEVRQTYAAMGRDTLDVREVHTSSRWLKWRVGCERAVQPGRGKPSVMWDGANPASAEAFMGTARYGGSGAAWKAECVADGLIPARIRITGIRLERLQDMTEKDARAEGATCIACGGSKEVPSFDGITLQACPCVTYAGADCLLEDYRQTWDTIHTKHGTRWEYSPLVWVLEFELVKGANDGAETHAPAR